MSNIYLLEPHTSGKVVLHTTQGDIDIELWPKEAPKACRNFVQLCMEGYYDDTIFHRIVAGFIIQGGDPEGTGMGGESIYGKPFQDEFHSRLRFVRRGLVAMANSGTPHDNRSQFFITLDATPELQNKHTIFGKVMGDTIFNVLKIGTLEVDADERPLYPPKITSCTIVINPFDDIVPRITKAEREAARQREMAAAKGPTVTAKPKKMKKNAALLSFGDDASEDDDQEALPIGKIGSSHDVLEDDPTLSKETVPIAKDTEPKRESSSSKSSRDRDRDRDRDEDRERAEIKRRRTERDEDRGKSSKDDERRKGDSKKKDDDNDHESYNDYDRRMREQVRERMEALKRKAATDQPPAAPSSSEVPSSARDQQKKEIEKLEKDIRKIHGMGADDESEQQKKKKREDKPKLSLLELEREKYKTRGSRVSDKRSSKGAAAKADADLLAKLTAFETKLRSTSTSSSATKGDEAEQSSAKKKQKEEGPPCELHGLSGCKSCQDSVGRAMEKQKRKEARLAGEIVEGDAAMSDDDDDDDDKDWMSHKLVFEKDPSKEGSQAGRRDNLDDYVVYDPLDKAAATNAFLSKHSEHSHRKHTSRTDMTKDRYRHDYRGNDRERGGGGGSRDYRDRDRDRERYRDDYRSSRSDRRDLIMQKVILLLLALCVNTALVAGYAIVIYNNDKSDWAEFEGGNSFRTCLCVKNTQTGYLKGYNGGDIKLFSTTDCTGNFQKVGSNSEVKNIQWVNSISYGKPGIPSSGPSGCPNFYKM
ncbi:Peptidyl-prolyl isomerase cwc27 [Actinomortierella wolfii]|nr:Peptidyl-prolyl isomerase cwc27 [Actinomortierella wolfii]